LTENKRTPFLNNPYDKDYPVDGQEMHTEGGVEHDEPATVAAALALAEIQLQRQREHEHEQWMLHVNLLEAGREIAALRNEVAKLSRDKTHATRQV
jgi:hypothetical protein